MNALWIGVVLVLAVAAAVVANIALLGVATGPNDPVGKLGPRAGLVRLHSTTVTHPTPGSTSSSDENGPGGRSQDD